MNPTSNCSRARLPSGSWLYGIVTRTVISTTSPAGSGICAHVVGKDATTRSEFAIIKVKAHLAIGFDRNARLFLRAHLSAACHAVDHHLQSTTSRASTSVSRACAKRTRKVSARSGMLSWMMIKLTAFFEVSPLAHATVVPLRPM